MSEYKLVWEENFDSEKINVNHWNFIECGCGFGNNEHQFYTARPENAFIKDGKLVIQALKEEYEGRPYTSAKLTTRNKFEWTYGRFEFKAKLPFGQGLWPAIWMMPADEEMYSGWPMCGEIDIMEQVGHEPGTVLGTIHYGNPHTYTGDKYTLPNGESFADDFHVFTLDWEPGEFRWYVDGVHYLTQNKWFSNVDGEEMPYPAPFNRDFYLQLNVAVGGNLPGYPDETTTFPQTMEIDYIKVYQKENY
jgi:beta-glucanase (GH16 family)